MIFPIGKSKHAIIRHVYENGAVKISDLLRNTGISAAAGYRYVEELLGSGILEERKEGKKPFLRILKPAFSEAGRSALTLVELDKTMEFMQKHRHLSAPLGHFGMEIAKNAYTAVVFGSFARGSEDKDSDLDILVLGGSKPKVERAKEMCFVTADTTISIRIIKPDNFVKSVKNGEGFAAGIARNHIVITNVRNWVDLVARIA